MPCESTTAMSTTNTNMINKSETTPNNVFMPLSITDEGVAWQCPHQEEDADEPCAMPNNAAFDDLVYQHKGKARGAVIALPKCSCGAQTFLKADYTIKELYKCLQFVSHEETGEAAYVLPLRYVNNLRLHSLLHSRGQAEYAPCIDMPPQALLEHPSFEGAKSSTVAALWLGYSTVRAYKPEQLTTRQTIMIGE